MGLPDVNIITSNGNLRRTSTVTSDGVAGMVLTGVAVAGKLELNKHYQLSSTADLTTYGITAENNPLAYKEITAFYQKTGDGAELHLLMVAEATTLTQMCAAEDGSPLRKLLDGAQGRIRLVGVNRLPPAEYKAETTQGIDEDAITAAAAAQSVCLTYQKKMRSFRLLMPAPAYDDTSDALYKPREGSYNAVPFVLASDDPATKTAAIGQILGRAASVSPQVSIARVRDGAIATDGYLTNGKSIADMEGKLAALHDAGYIIYRSFPTRNGVYLNDDPTAAPVSDDFSNLNTGRIIDKARMIVYEAYLSEVMDNVEADENGFLTAEAALAYQGVFENAIADNMDGQISGFSAYVEPKQNILGTSKLKAKGRIRLLGTLRDIEFDLGLENPYKNS